MPSPLLDQVCHIAARAGEALLRHRGGELDVRLKEDGSPVTAADLEAHHLITTGLAALDPACPVLSEESSSAAIAGRRSWRRLWVVDPLDGTREFIRGSPEFSVNIALVEEGVPVLGVVHLPAMGLTHLGRRGGGAWRREGLRAPVPVHTRRADPARVRLAVGRSPLGPRTRALLQRLPGALPVPLGNALKLSRLAEGELDLFVRFGPTMEWDTAAPHCILEAAGGSISDLEGRPLRYNKESLENPGFGATGDGGLSWRLLLR